MSTLGIIIEVLSEHYPRSLNAREIVARANGRLPTRSKTPQTVVSRDLALGALKERSPIKRVSPGRFTLVRDPRVASYEEIIARKSGSIASAGFTLDESAVAPHLFPHQKDLVRWALRRGRAAIFADTGLGKTCCFLEWSRHVAADHGRVLILAPLACGPQHEEEAQRFGVPAKFLREDDGESDIVIANYEMLHRFNPADFAGVVLDESSILKSFEGRTRCRLIEAFADVPFRLACTATPAPNDFSEMGNHSEFLGLKTRAEMLAEFFVHDGGSTQDWRIKGHAVDVFWRWVSTWGAVLKSPSDLGHDDSRYLLPSLELTDRIVLTPDDVRTAWDLSSDARTLTEQRKVRRATIASRVQAAAELVRKYAEDGDQSIVWCELNDEQSALSVELGELCVSIEGSTPEDVKLRRYSTWKSGDVPCLVSKPSIFGFGLNWQHCRRMIFIGASHSYERTYQAIRRCWRFGQRREVTVDMVRADLEAAVADNYRRKERDSARMGEAMRRLVADAVKAEVRGLTREFNPYEPEETMILPEWLK